jgi:heme-degrading monooxygenase HmoA
MYGRLSRFAGLPPERIDETLRQFEEEQLPVLEQQRGYRGVMVMVNRGTGQAAAITLWETADNMRESDKVADQARAAAVATAQPSREPVVDSYEVLMIKQLASTE